MNEFLKSLLIRTPVEEPLQQLREFLKTRIFRNNPDLIEIHREPQRIEQLMRQVIQPTSNCLDIGCHLGATLSKIVKLAPQGRHMAFEPIPYKVDWLKRKFPEVEIHPVALSDRGGEATFYINRGQSGFSGLSRHGKTANSFQEIQVKCEVLDQLLPPDYRVDFLKIDTEGHELAALQGAKGMLTTYHPILLFECTASGLRAAGFTPEQVFTFLTQKCAYSVFLIPDFLDRQPPLTVEAFSQALRYPFQGFNFVAAAV